MEGRMTLEHLVSMQKMLIEQCPPLEDITVEMIPVETVCMLLKTIPRNGDIVLWSDIERVINSLEEEQNETI